MSSCGARKVALSSKDLDLQELLTKKLLLITAHSLLFTRCVPRTAQTGFHYSSAARKSRLQIHFYSVLHVSNAHRRGASALDVIFFRPEYVNLPLHDPLLTFRSLCPSRHAFRSAPACTETHRKSIIPSLLRFSINPSTIKSDPFLNFARNLT